MQWPRLSASRSARLKKNMWGIILIIILIMLNKLVVSSFIQCLQYKCHYFHTHHPSPQVRTIIIGTFKQRSSKMLWQLVSSKVLLQIYIPFPIPSFLFLFLFLQGASTRKPHCLLEILARLAQGEKIALHVLEIWRALILHWLHWYYLHWVASRILNDLEQMSQYLTKWLMSLQSSNVTW